jgi:hypothetical protein
MNDPHHILTPELQALICAYIRSGAFPQIAAEAAGIPQKVFDRWMRYGQARRPLALYRDFAQAVRQAQAQARLLAENHALQQSPLNWLKSGPGKETARMPGWTSPVKPAMPALKETGLSRQRLMDFIACLLTALEPFPEARLAAADALERGGWMAEPEQVEMPRQGEVVVASGETSAQADAVAERGRDIPAAVQGIAVTPAGNAASNGEERVGTPQGTETGVQPTCKQMTTKRQANGNKPAAKLATGPTPVPQNRPGAWDSLDARTWIGFTRNISSEPAKKSRPPALAGGLC